MIRRGPGDEQSAMTLALRSGTPRLSSAAAHEAQLEWDVKMMARVKVGDDRALEAIYQQYSSLVYGIAHRLVGASTAADVTQQVFLRLWERPDSFDASRGALRTLLTVMTRRRSIDWLRSSGRTQRREEFVGRDVADWIDDVDDGTLASESAAQVRAAIQQLPDEQRTAVELAYFGGLTYRQVAEATGVSEGTAKSRLRLALGRLARFLQDDDHGWAPA
jgi:RNA polymerase sigma-70 factor (ECF subfamily)